MKKEPERKFTIVPHDEIPSVIEELLGKGITILSYRVFDMSDMNYTVDNRWITMWLDVELLYRMTCAAEDYKFPKEEMNRAINSGAFRRRPVEELLELSAEIVKSLNEIKANVVDEL